MEKAIPVAASLWEAFFCNPFVARRATATEAKPRGLPSLTSLPPVGLCLEGTLTKDSVGSEGYSSGFGKNLSPSTERLGITLGTLRNHLPHLKILLRLSSLEEVRGVARDWDAGKIRIFAEIRPGRLRRY